METINDITSLGVPVLLTLACNIVAEAMKMATKEKINRWLPLILMVLGGVVYPFLADATKVTVNAANPTVYMVIVGVCIGGMAVGLNQVVQQFVKKPEVKP